MPDNPKLIFGNWKMQLTAKESIELASALVAGIQNPESSISIAVFPSFVALESVHAVLKDSSMALGGQDCFWEEKGAFTGEVSPTQLVAAGCSYVLIGHSERRMHQKETDEMVNKKVRVAQSAGLTPVLCLGESAAERENGTWSVVIERQLRGGLLNVALSGSQQIVIAYEPVWAIGTGKACDPDEAQNAHELIRTLLNELYGQEKARKDFHLIYGGSVDAKNIGSYLVKGDIDGTLVGGASQKSASFIALIAAAAR